MLIFRAQSSHVLVRVVTSTPSIVVISSAKNCPTWPITPLRRGIAMVSGREMWMPGASEPGRKPGKSQIRKAVAWEAAENCVDKGEGPGMELHVQRSVLHGNRIPRLGMCSERMLEPAPADPASAASRTVNGAEPSGAGSGSGCLHRPIVAKPRTASESYPQAAARAPNSTRSRGRSGRSERPLLRVSWVGFGEASWAGSAEIRRGCGPRRGKPAWRPGAGVPPP